MHLFGFSPVPNDCTPVMKHITTFDSSKHAIILTTSHTFQLSDTIRLNPSSEKLFFNGMLYYVGNGDSGAIAIELMNSTNDTIVAKVIEVDGKYRKAYFTNGLADPQLETRYMNRPELRHFQESKIVALKTVNDHLTTVLCSYFLDNAHWDPAYEDTVIKLDAKFSIIHDNGKARYIDLSKMSEYPYSVIMNSPYLSNDSLIIKLNGEEYVQSKPLFCLFRMSRDSNYVFDKLIEQPQLPECFIESGHGYLDSWGFMRNGIYSGGVVPIFYDLRSGATFNLSEEICSIDCTHLLKNPGNGYWLNDVRIQSSGYTSILYHTASGAHLSVIDIFKHRAVSTINIGQEIQFGSMVFTSDSTFAGISLTGMQLVTWEFTIR